MKTTEQILDKIKKCLALANGRNATPGEMEAAMAAAKRIADDNNIELATVNWNTEAGKRTLEAGKEDVHFRSKYEQIYHRPIYSVLLNVFGIVILSSRYSITFIGEKTDIAICQVLFPWLEDVFFKTCYQATRSGRIEDRVAPRRSLFFGLARGIISANTKQEAARPEQEAQTMAMVVRNKKQVVADYMAAEFPKLRNRKTVMVSTHNLAYQIGIAAGEKINLRQTTAGRPVGALN